MYIHVFHLILLLPPIHTAPRKSSSLKRKATQAELDQEILDSRTVTVEELREGLDFDLLPFLGIGEPILFPNYEDLLGLL